MSNEPEISELDDGRDAGVWNTHYPFKAWSQIALELTYSLSLLFFGIFILYDGALTIARSEEGTKVLTSALTGFVVAEEAAKWIALSAAGLIGGSVFVLKWLYHSVAKRSWHQDRLLWRLIVPFNSATVSLFTGFLFASGIIPFLKDETFEEIYTLLGFGFVFGYFSDNILAALQNLAQRVFGTLDSDD